MCCPFPVLYSWQTLLMNHKGLSWEPGRSFTALSTLCSKQPLTMEWTWLERGTILGFLSAFPKTLTISSSRGKQYYLLVGFWCQTPGLGIPAPPPSLCGLCFGVYSHPAPTSSPVKWGQNQHLPHRSGGVGVGVYVSVCVDSTYLALCLAMCSTKESLFFSL